MIGTTCSGWSGKPYHLFPTNSGRTRPDLSYILSSLLNTQYELITPTKDEVVVHAPKNNVDFGTFQVF